MRQAVAELGRIELEQAQQFIDARRSILRLVPAEQLGHGADVLRHGAMREEAVALDGIADPAAQLDRPAARDILAVDADVPGRSARPAG